MSAEEIQFSVLNEKDFLSEHNYCTWRGQYTLGTVWARGTAVGFFRNAAMVLDDEEHEWRVVRFNENVSAANALPTETYPNEDGNIRCEDLATIVDCLKTEKQSEFIRVFRGSLASFFDAYKIELPYATELDLTTERTMILRFINETQPDRVIIATEFAAIVVELEKVLELCKQHNIVFHWI